MNRTNVDNYLRTGCGRCDRFDTPACKVHGWTDVLVALRALVLETGLDECLKWGHPCYTLNGANVVLISSRVDRVDVSFLKGAALRDDAGLLEAPGPNSRIARIVKVTSVDQVDAQRDALRALLEQAIAFEKAGGTVDPPPAEHPMPDELADALDADAELRTAFEALTPGRQRGYLIFIGQGKQAATRRRRIEKLRSKILAGKGPHER